MKYGSLRFMRALTIAALAMLALVTVSLAQTDTETITVEVQGAPPYECNPVGTATIDARFDWGSSLEVDHGATTANDDWTSMTLLSGNTGCGHWSVTAEIDDFKLTTDEAVTFSGSTLYVVKNTSILNNPQRYTTGAQPAWVRALPPDLATGVPTMPERVDFAGSPTASGNMPLLSASTAEYGTPGNSVAYYYVRLNNVPADQQPGIYTSQLRVTLQGGD